MNAEIKSLIEDAAKLLGYKHVADNIYDAGDFVRVFDPCDPERGDLEKLMDAAELEINYADCTVWEYETFLPPNRFTKGDHDSKVLAILRAASAVYKSRGGV